MCVCILLCYWRGGSHVFAYSTETGDMRCIKHGRHETTAIQPTSQPTFSKGKTGL